MSKECDGGKRKDGGDWCETHRVGMKVDEPEMVSRGEE